MIFILNNKGTTLLESLLAFSIFISVVILFVSFYTVIVTKNNALDKEYQEYKIEQENREQEICLEESLSSIIERALP